MSLDSLFLMRFEWLTILVILALLILKLSDFEKRILLFFPIIEGIFLVNALAGFLPIANGELFTGFFKSTPLIVLEKNILNISLLLIVLTSRSWVRTLNNKLEFYILLMSSMLGVFTMLSSGHILTLYLGLEMSTIPLAALANFNTDSKKSSEAGIKLILSSAFSTGILLFGISLLYGAVGNLHFSYIVEHIKPDTLSVLAFVFILSGFAFKMSVVPFHFWTADVYEGSPIPVTNYLAAISKGSVIFVMINVLYYLFGNLKDAWLFVISILAVLSMTIGNLFALRQENIKRLLAFSSIAQVGFVLVGLAGASVSGSAAVVYFVIIYLFSNIAAFGVVGAIADSTGSEDLHFYKGLYKQFPALALILGISLFSLAGIPPTAGFFGKLFLLNAGMGNKMYVLLGFAAVNLVLSLYNYLRVVKVMFIDEQTTPLPEIKNDFALNTALYFSVIGILTIGYFSPIYEYISRLAF
jgi:NADH-quinone oxidoreductase subunit N